VAVAGERQGKLSFGTFEVDPTSGKLLKRGSALQIQEKPLQLLLLLLEHPGEIVFREDLQRRLWAEGTYVDFDKGLNTAIKKLRHVLGDSADAPVFIETVPRKGYRFIAPVSVSNISHRQTFERSELGEDSFKNPATDLPVSSRRLALVTCAVLVVTTLALTAIRLIATGHPPDVRNMRITKVTESGKIREMAVSPDGRYLAYALNQGLEQSLWIKGIHEAKALQLLPPETVNFSGISFSPNGNSLYFIRSEKTNPVFSYMCRMPSGGGKVEQLIRDADSPASFSPDGSRFVYTRGYPPRNVTQVRIADRDGRGDHALIELDGHQVFEAGATWSPDGARIAAPIHIVGERSRFVLYVISAVDGTTKELFSSQGDIGRPLWYSNNKLLVTLRTEYAKGGQLWTISYPDGSAERFTNDLTDYSSAIDFSGDRKKLAAIVNSVVSNIWVAAANDLSHPAQVTSGGPSPLRVRELQDGRVVALVNGIEPTGLRARELPDGRTTSEESAVWTMNVDGTHRASWAGIDEPEWIEPCGKALLVLSNKDGGSLLSRYENGSPTPEALASGDVQSPACSMDGKFTYYLNFSHPEKIRRISNTDGTLVEIADVLGDTVFGSLAVSPDGNLLAYPYQRYSPPRVAIAVIPATGGPPIREFTIPGFSEMLRWSPDGSALQYLLSRSGVTNLWEQPLHGSEPRQITQFNIGQIFDFSWTRDGSRLLLARGESNTDVILIEHAK
jgi:eukaryotic-like serine/threonine-protein kinase